MTENISSFGYKMEFTNEKLGRFKRLRTMIPISDHERLVIKLSVNKDIPNARPTLTIKHEQKVLDDMQEEKWDRVVKDFSRDLARTPFDTVARDIGMWIMDKNDLSGRPLLSHLPPQHAEGPFQEIIDKGLSLKMMEKYVKKEKVYYVMPA